MKRKKLSDAQRRQRERINICLKLDPERDAKVLELLNKRSNKQGYIKSLILNDKE